MTNPQTADQVKDFRLDDFPFEKSWVIAIGINKYGNGLQQLSTAVNDATAVQKTLVNLHHFNEFRLLTDEQASRDALKALLETELPSKVGKNDRVFFYFAGHGKAESNESGTKDEHGNVDRGPKGYLLPSDAELGKESTYLSMTDVHGWLTSLTCRHMLIVLDSCFSGAFKWAGTRTAGDVDDVIRTQKYMRYVNYAAWQVITSTSQDQTALDALSDEDALARSRGASDGGHSPFAATLLRKLSMKSGEERRKDGLLTPIELYLDIEESVQDEGQKREHRQVPMLWELPGKDDGGQFVFFVGGKFPPRVEDAPPLDEKQNPWLGLKSYDVGDADRFFGRGAQIKKLREHVESRPLTVVLGPSGTGKSSLVKAGLVPTLIGDDGWYVLHTTERDLDDKKDRNVYGMRPGARPFEALLRAVDPMYDPRGLNMTAVHAVGTAERTNARDEIKRRVATLRDGNDGRKIALVIDRFEELISLSRGDVRDDFLKLLAELVRSHDWLHIVVAVRSDFEPGFTLAGAGAGDGETRAFRNLWEQGVFKVDPMSRDDLRAVIEGPAKAKVMFFTPAGLVEDLIAEVDATPGALPLLSFALSQLYVTYFNRVRNDQAAGKIVDRAITRSDYDALGGVAGALRQKADEVYQDPRPDAEKKDAAVYSPEQIAAAQQTMQHVMLRMVVREGGHLAGRRVSDTELEFPDEQENTGRKDVVQRLVKEGLLVRGSAHGEGFVEPAHDALIREWGRLQTWVAALDDDASRAAATARERRHGLHRLARFLGVSRDPEPYILEDRQRLARAAGEYADAKKQAKERPDLWVGRARSAQLAHVVKSHASWLNKWEVDFALRSINRRFRNDVISLSVGVLVLTLFFAAFGFGVSATVLAARATLRQLAAETRSALDNGNLDRAALLAVEASTLPVPEVRSPLLTWQLTTPRLHGYLRDTSGVYNVSLSPDGKTLASAGEKDSAVTLWLVSTREPGGMLPGVGAHDSSVLVGRSGRVLSLAYSPDTTTNTLAVATADGAVVLWDTAKRDTLETLPREPSRGNADLSFSPVAFSPDGRLLAKGEDSAIVLWEIRSHGGPAAAGKGRGPKLPHDSIEPGKPIHAGKDAENAAFRDTRSMRLRSKIIDTLEATDALRSLTFSPDGRILAAVTKRGVTLWRITRRPGYVVDSGETYWSISHQNTKVWQRIYQNNRADSLSLPHWIYKGDTLDQGVDTQRDERLAARTRGAETAAFSPDGQMLAVAMGDKRSGSQVVPDATVILWDLARPQPRDTLRGHTGGASRVAFSPRRDTVATGSADGTVIMWDISQRGHPKRIDEPLHGHGDAITALSFGPDGQRLVSASEDGKVIVWNTGRADTTVAKTALVRRPNGALSVVLSPDRRTVASAQPDGTVILWQVTEEDSLRKNGPQPQPRTRSDSTILFSPGSGTLAVAGDDSIMLWDLKDQRPLAPLRGRGGPRTRVVFSPDGRTLAAAGNSLVVWDLKQKRDTLILRPDAAAHVTSAAFSSRGWIAAGYSDGWIYARRNHFRSWTQSMRDFFEHPWEHVTFRWQQIFDRHENAEDPDDKIDRALGHEGPVMGLAYSPDGKTLVSAHDDGSIIKRNAFGLRKLGSTHGHNGEVRSLAYSPDGQTLASAGSDRDVILWDVENMRRRGTPLRLSDSSAARSFVFSGDALAAVGDSGITFWNIGLEPQKTRACEAAGRNLSEREWEESFGGDYERACKRYPGEAPVSGKGRLARLKNGTVGWLTDHETVRDILAYAWQWLWLGLLIWLVVRLWRRPKWQRHLAKKLR